MRRESMIRHVVCSIWNGKGFLVAILEFRMMHAGWSYSLVRHKERPLWLYATLDVEASHCILWGELVWLWISNFFLVDGERSFGSCYTCGQYYIDFVSLFSAFTTSITFYALVFFFFSMVLSLTERLITCSPYVRAPCLAISESLNNTYIMVKKMSVYLAFTCF